MEVNWFLLILIGGLALLSIITLYTRTRPPYVMIQTNFKNTHLIMWIGYFIIGFILTRTLRDPNYIDFTFENIITIYLSILLVVFTWQSNRLTEEYNRPILIGWLENFRFGYIFNSGNSPAYRVTARYKEQNEPYREHRAFFQVIFPLQWLRGRTGSFKSAGIRFDLPEDWRREDGNYNIMIEIDYFDEVYGGNARLFVSLARAPERIETIHENETS